MKIYQVAILGFGVVGSGVYRIIKENHDDLKHREGVQLHTKRVLVRSLKPQYFDVAPEELFTTNFYNILNDDDVSIVIECMGGVEPARTFILKALKAGKTVVTSNKEVISKHWYEFEKIAKQSGAGLYYEATVGGGIPILRTVTDSMQANNISRVLGVINGTTNYILTKMAEEGKTYEETLIEAQKLGYAEADPTADVEGYDATYKLSILASMAFHAHLPVPTIYREGITGLSAMDFQTAKQLGYTIKLLAIGKKQGNSIEVRVHPTMISKDHPLCGARGVFNAVFLTGSAVDDIMLYGRGAGAMPTASAVVSDVIYACHRDGRHRYMTFVNHEQMSDQIELVSNFSSGYCLRILVTDSTGVLSKITQVFAQHNVSLSTVLQTQATDGEASIVMVTHGAMEMDMKAAVEGIKVLDCVKSVLSVIRVEE